MHGVFAAFAELGVTAEPVVFSNDAVESVREQLLALDGALVWVNPIEQGLDRSLLDPLLSQVAEAGVFVSAHPDVILKMGTKQVLCDTREMSWSTDIRIYRTADELRVELPARLAAGPRVLKQHRGMGGNGVWKVDAARDSDVIVQHASGETTPERMPFELFAARCASYFEGGLMVEQPYHERLPEGMIRAYLSHDRVVGFTHQHPRGLMPPGTDHRPSGKRWELPGEPRFAGLRQRLEAEWVPQMQQLLGLTTHELPVIWDADFLFGATSETGEDSYVLCEINVSSTFAFPEFAMPTVARTTLDRIAERAAMSAPTN